MKTRFYIGAILLTIMSLSCLGCATVTFLPAADSTAYTPTKSLKVYWKEPQRSYTVIGMVSAESTDFDEKTLFGMLKQKAMAIGAHAIVMGGRSRRSSGGVAMPLGTSFVFIPSTSTRIEALAIRFTN